MSRTFDKDYWESHWQQAKEHGPDSEFAPNPYLARELRRLTPSTALDAGCGEGAAAIWLANEGWRVTGADISVMALARASKLATQRCSAPERVRWVKADLSVWEPSAHFDLVTTHYAHPETPQLAFYRRISDWVAPGGTLLIVGHMNTAQALGHAHNREGQPHRHEPPEAASATAASIVAGLEATTWDVVTADEPTRTLTDRAGQSIQLNDVVVRATRRP